MVSVALWYDRDLLGSCDARRGQFWFTHAPGGINGETDAGAFPDGLDHAAAWNLLRLYKI
jgi:hypothetical protein